MRLIRHSMQFASWNERKAIAAALAPISLTVRNITAKRKRYDWLVMTRR